MTDVSPRCWRRVSRGARLGRTWVMAARRTIAAAALACLLAPQAVAGLVAGHLVLNHHESAAAPANPLAPAWHERDASAAPHDHALSPGGERDMELRRAAPLTPPDAGIPAHAPGSPVPATVAALGDALRGPEAQEPARVVRGEEASVLGELPGDAVDHGRLVLPRGRAGLAPPSHLRLRRRRPRAA